MVTHTDTPAVEAPAAEAPAVEAVPDTQPAEPANFNEALEMAMSRLEESAPEPAPEPTPEPTPEPEQTTTAEPAADAEPTKETETDLLESLTADVGDDWTPKAANRFKELKSELKSNRSELETLQQTVREQEAKMKEMSGLVEDKDIESLQAKVTEYERQKSITDLESTDAYVQTVKEPLNQLLDTVVAVAERYGADPDSVVDALTLEDAAAQDERLSELLYGATDRDKASVYRVIEDLKPILNKREELFQNAEEALREAQYLDEQKQNAVAAEESRLRSNVTQNVVDRIQEKLPFLKAIDGLDMSAIQTKAADTIPSTVHPVDFAYSSVASQLLPVIVKQYVEASKQNDHLTDQLAQYESAEPTVSGASPADGSKPSSNISFADAINAALG